MTPNECGSLLLYDLMVQIATTGVRTGLAMTPNGCIPYQLSTFNFQLLTKGGSS